MGSKYPSLDFVRQFDRGLVDMDGMCTLYVAVADTKNSGLVQYG